MGLEGGRGFVFWGFVCLIGFFGWLGWGFLRVKQHVKPEEIM